MLRSVQLLDFTNPELSIAAQARGAITYQEGERAKKMENPKARGRMERAAKCYRTLAETFERVRRT